MIKGRIYCLTWLGFSLNVAQKIISTIMNVVMSQDEEIRRETSSYIDDVYVNENVASSRRVKELLERFDLVLTVWVDATSLAMGVALEDNGSIIEDVCWLRPENASRHKDLAELDVTVKGINLVLQWQVTVLHIVTDSACTQRWISDALTGRARLTTKASSDILIRRRLATLTKTMKEYNLFVDVALDKSAVNRADSLTRVPQCWWLLHGKSPNL